MKGAPVPSHSVAVLIDHCRTNYGSPKSLHFPPHSVAFLIAISCAKIVESIFQEKPSEKFQNYFVFVRKRACKFNLEKLWIFNLSRFQVVDNMLLCEAGIRK
jgi:hypothetical protein